jgi:predicted dehydrogenase
MIKGGNDTMKLAILGAGSIAIKMANTIAPMENVESYAVAARDLGRAKAFADQYGFKKAYGSYEEMLRDKEIDLVYIATPHSHHFEHAKMSLMAGKNVLCEKSFTVTAEQARTLFALAEEKKLLITEAIWTRYMPSRKMIDDIIKSGVIGEVTSLTANLSYELDGVERLWTPELAGGALLDLGVYTINFSRMVFGENMTDISASAVFKNGVDMTDSITMVFDGDKVATTQTSAYAAGDRRGAIFGTKGFIEVTNINNPEEIKVFDMEYKEIASYLPPKQITGYEYEVEACERAIANGDLECPEMPHAETIKILEIMEDIRRSWGYEIPER